MIVFESRRVRRLIARVERSESLHSALSDLASTESIRAGWVKGLGELEWVELEELDQAQCMYRPARRIGPCTLVSLEGNISVAGGEPSIVLHATLSRETEAGLQLLGGRLRAARAFRCEIQVEVFQDLELERSPDSATGLKMWMGHSRAVDAAEPVESAEAPPSMAEGAPVSWSAVAAASEAAKSAPAPVAYEDIDLEPGRRRITRKKPEPSVPLRGVEPMGRAKDRGAKTDYLDVPDPEVGDFIEHRQFGVCKVERLEGDGGLVIKLPTSRRKRIKLEVFDVQPPRHDKQGRRIFQLKPRKR